MTSDQFCLRWNNFQSSIITNLESLKCDEDLVDVTLTCEGKSVKAHKLILSACSSYFKTIFKENPCAHPVVILKGVSFVDITSVISFMYQGEVHIAQDKLESFLRTAELLEVRGLADVPSPNIADFKLKDRENRNANAEHSDPPKSPTSLPPTSSPNTSLPNQYEGHASPSGPSSSNPPYYGPSQTLNPPTPVPYQTDPKTVQSGESASAPDSESGEGEEVDTWSKGGKTWDMIPKQEPLEGMGSESPVLPAGVGSEEGTQPFEWHNLSASGSESSNQNMASHDPGSHFLEHPNTQMPFGAVNQGTLVDERGGEGRGNQEIDAAHLANELPVVGGDYRKPHKCPICHRVYSNYFNMKQHSINVHYPGKVNCAICSRTFNNKLYLRKHMVRCHGAPLIREDRATCIPCTLCNKIISNKSNLIKHMKIRHSSGSTAEKCHHCGKIFKNKYSLKYHCYMYHRQMR